MRRYAWRPDLPDARDHLLPAPKGGLPRRVDLRDRCSPVEDQGALGSCTGNAIVGALEFLLLRDGPLVHLSRLFVYYQERVLEGTVPVDDGAEIRSGVKACRKVGVCEERLWPYRVRRFADRPSESAYKDAAGRRISEYLRVTTLRGLKRSLADGFPVAFGFTVYASFEGAGTARTGMATMPKAKEKPLGGHAVLAVGYDDDVQMLIVRNSWGPRWGLAGYFLLPYGYVESRGLSDDFWTIRR